MTPGDDLFPAEDGDTPLTPEEQLDLIPSLSTRAQLNELERHTIHTARVWAMRPKSLARPDLLTDTFARELRARYLTAVRADDENNFALLLAVAKS